MQQHMTTRTIAVDLPPRSVRGGPGRHEPVPELRTITVDDFVDAVLEQMDDAGIERAVLVGHSLAGITIPEVARQAPDRVAHLVFIACTVPAEGQSVFATRDPDAGRLTTPDTLRHYFGTDLDDEAMQLVRDNVGGEALHAMTQVMTRTGLDPTIPKTWIRTLRDNAVTLAQQDQFIENLRRSPGGEVRVIDIDTGHNVMLARPVELAAILEQLAR